VNMGQLRLTLCGVMCAGDDVYPENSAAYDPKGFADRIEHRNRRNRMPSSRIKEFICLEMYTEKFFLLHA
jgi:hypothetical protein